MIVFNKYVNGKDHTWYDSSNVFYSLCYDNPGAKKILRIVFKQGRTYLYKDVDVNDYIAFKMSPSSGEGVNINIIKKYPAIRLPDTDLESLETMREEFTNDNKKAEEVFSNFAYHIDYDEISGNFKLSIDDKVIYQGIEGQVSIVNLFRSMNLNYSMSACTIENLVIETGEENNELR